MKPVVLLSLLGTLILAGPFAGLARGQAPAPPSPAKICAERWNALKASGQTGEQSFRDFSAQCLKDAGAAGPGESTPTQEPAPRRSTTPTGASAAAAQPSMKQCADLWNEMKAKNQTGTQTYRDFAQDCLAGTGVLDGAPAPPPPAPAANATPPNAAPPNAAPPKSSVPSVPRPVATPAPDPAPSLTRPPDENDRAAVNRCNSEWQAYKARHNLTGAKAWHVFMARCLP
ncbi:hypothetical protein [Ancylobacter sp. IITR112]|uniref:hypothetical protein n=1 Tax=Ancylobacter sp. IITR112 TaxID=3138073 RepID=UPI00352B2A4D